MDIALISFVNSHRRTRPMRNGFHGNRSAVHDDILFALAIKYDPGNGAGGKERAEFVA